MKPFYLSVLCVALIGCSQAFGQVEPTPLVTPDDIPVSTPRPPPASDTAAKCAECSMHGCEDGDKPNGTPKPVESDEAVLIKLEQDWGDALAHHDVNSIERIESDDYAYTGPDGAVSHKPEEIAAAKAEFARIDSFKHREIKVRVYGETAVVTGATTLKGAAGDTDLSGDFRWTDVFVKRDGRWQVVSSQATAISKAAAED